MAFEEGAAEGTAPELTVIKSDWETTIIDFKLCGMYKEQRTEQGEVFDLLRLPRPHSGLMATCGGGPEVPNIGWYIAIPPVSYTHLTLPTN